MTIKADEVRRELQEAADALGDSRIVARFVRDACARLGAPLAADGSYWRLAPAALPAPVRERAGFDGAQPIRLGFELPVPERVHYVAAHSSASRGAGHVPPRARSTRRCATWPPAAVQSARWR
ncbi:MAG: hypothetical protein U0841_21910 [Chloroflexia bacterium]